jgi:uncharacterized protein
MSWHDLVLLHWSLPPEELRPFVPAEVELDTHGGRAWVSLVAFSMGRVGLRGGLRLPGRMGEVNLRTYVRHPDPGIWFWSLDCSSRATVELLRRAFLLPYLKADIRTGSPYRCERRDGRAAAAGLELAWRPEGEPAPPRPDTLDHFLSERYVLYTQGRPGGPVWRGDIQHGPYPLQGCRVEVLRNTMLARWPGLDSLRPDRVGYARGLDVVAWPLARSAA